MANRYFPFLLPIAGILIPVIVFSYTCYTISDKGKIIKQMTEVGRKFNDVQKRMSILEREIQTTELEIRRNAKGQLLADVNQILHMIEAISEGIDTPLKERVGGVSEEVKEIIESMK